MMFVCVYRCRCLGALAHHVGLHLGELTNLGRQGAAEAVTAQTLGWGGERTNMSQYNGMLIIA